MGGCRGFCLSCKNPCDDNHEWCHYCRELVRSDEIRQYTSWIDGEEVTEWACDACVARGVFDVWEETYEALEARTVAEVAL